MVFRELARASLRARSGPIRVHFVAPLESDGCVAVAYSVSRGIGNAVVRNRCRRRMRAIVVRVAEELPAGAYLVSVGGEVVGLDFAELEQRLVEAMRNASRSKR